MAREKIIMRSTGLKPNGKSTGYFKTEMKNRKNETTKRERQIYDPRIRKRIKFYEKKIK